MYPPNLKAAEITNYLESIAPLNYQEDYDNSGLIVGNASDEINAALVALDCTEQIVDEAIAKQCNLIITHHPIVFKGLKKFNGKTYVIAGSDHQTFCVFIVRLHSCLDACIWFCPK